MSRDRGRQAEEKVAKFLEERGFAVENLNDHQTNHLIVDLRASKGRRTFNVSVKSAWTKTRQLRLGSRRSLEALGDDDFVIALLPREKGREMNLEVGEFVVWIIPGAVARDEALEAHYHYADSNPGSLNHSVMVKDKTDRSPHTKSGAVFHSWARRFEEAWHLLD